MHKEEKVNKKARIENSGFFMFFDLAKLVCDTFVDNDIGNQSKDN